MQVSFAKYTNMHTKIDSLDSLSINNILTYW